LALKKEPLISAKAKENSEANLKQNAEVQISSPRKDPTQKSAEGETREQVAKIAGVSHDTVNKYKQVKEKASPELLNEVLNLPHTP
jgi:transcriptional regulator with XRE-family HTH domain